MYQNMQRKKLLMLQQMIVLKMNQQVQIHSQMKKSLEWNYELFLNLIDL